ncbi:MAG: hypothetical protein R2735_05405 [Microthrixaceae bacterium]
MESLKKAYRALRSVRLSTWAIVAIAIGATVTHSIVRPDPVPDPTSNPAVVTVPTTTPTTVPITTERPGKKATTTVVPESSSTVPAESGYDNIAARAGCPTDVSDSIDSGCT